MMRQVDQHTLILFEQCYNDEEYESWASRFYSQYTNNVRELIVLHQIVEDRIRYDR